MPEIQHPTRDEIRIEALIRALDHPIRLRVVRALAATDGDLSCEAVLPDVTKSSASHHWRVLREGGVIRQCREGRYTLQRLRREDLDARFPGVLDAVIGRSEPSS